MSNPRPCTGCGLPERVHVSKNPRCAYVPVKRTEPLRAMRQSLRSVTLLLHKAGDTWWAESPEVPGFSVAAGGYTELLLAAHEVLAEDLTETERLDVRISYDVDLDEQGADEPKGRN